MKQKYAQAALRVTSSCCAASLFAARTSKLSPRTYDEKQKEDPPTEAVLASLSCGNPTALTQLNPGKEEATVTVDAYAFGWT